LIILSPRVFFHPYPKEQNQVFNPFYSPLF
jgi:hypothetical protein